MRYQELPEASFGLRSPLMDIVKSMLPLKGKASPVPVAPLKHHISCTMAHATTWTKKISNTSPGAFADRGEHLWPRGPFA